MSSDHATVLQHGYHSKTLSHKKRNKSQLYAAYKTHFKYKDTSKLKAKGRKKTYHANINQETTRMATLIAEKVDFRKILPEIESFHSFNGSKSLKQYNYS